MNKQTPILKRDYERVSAILARLESHVDTACERHDAGQQAASRQAIEGVLEDWALAVWHMKLDGRNRTLGDLAAAAAVYWMSGARERACEYQSAFSELTGARYGSLIRSVAEPAGVMPEGQDWVDAFSATMHDALEEAGDIHAKYRAVMRPTPADAYERLAELAWTCGRACLLFRPAVSDIAERSPLAQRAGQWLMDVLNADASFCVLRAQGIMEAADRARKYPVCGAVRGQLGCNGLIPGAMDAPGRLLRVFIHLVDGEDARRMRAIHDELVRGPWKRLRRFVDGPKGKYSFGEPDYDGPWRPLLSKRAPRQRLV